MTNIEDQVYQIRIYLKGTSPMVWRRLHIRDNSTLLDLHNVIQIVMGWSNSCMNEFILHGRYYTVPNLYSFTSINALDGRNILLKDLDLKLNRRFLYRYDFSSIWNFELILEQILSLKNKSYPFYIGGSGVSPFEDCGSVEEFYNLRDKSLLDALEMVENCVSKLLDPSNAKKEFAM